MKKEEKVTDRRSFVKQSSLLAIGSASLLGFAPVAKAEQQTSQNDINIVGPKEGFTPQIGTLVSMMNWMRNTMLYPVRGLSVKELDYIHDANSIGAMLLHLAATERFYQIHTFENKKWGDWSREDQKRWATASALGAEGRKKIKGYNLDFYLDALSEVRANSLKEFAKRDDEWLLKVDEDWFWGPTNNYCKWFHVCEHESNHNGQIKWLKSRLST
ncbi:MAG: DinB family protein [Bacteroidota bacterium]